MNYSICVKGEPAWQGQGRWKIFMVENTEGGKITVMEENESSEGFLDGAFSIPFMDWKNEKKVLN